MAYFKELYTEGLEVAYELFPGAEGQEDEFKDYLDSFIRSYVNLKLGLELQEKELVKEFTGHKPANFKRA